MKAFWKWWREHVSFSSTRLLFALLIIWLHRLTDSSSLLFALVVQLRAAGFSVSARAEQYGPIPFSKLAPIMAEREVKPHHDTYR
jgi:hypothetical protein